MIVLAIMAGIAGLTWPVLMRPWSRSLAQQAAQQLVEQIGEARRRSVEESRVYRLRWRPGTGQFEISAPGAAAELAVDERMTPAGRSAQTMREAEMASSSDEAPTPRVTSADPSSTSSLDRGDSMVIPPTPPWQLDATLDQGVRFASQNNGLDTASDINLPIDSATPSFAAREPMSEDDPGSLEEGSTSETTPQVPWSEPVWFQPDGRTSNAQWTLRSEDGYEVKVVLRGLTGTARVGQVRRAPVNTVIDEQGEDLDQTERSRPASIPNQSSPER